jgi:DNA-binding GntR family transcriptional regulator
VSTLKLQSTASALADRIRDEIFDGRLSAGDPLPQEEIAARYGVSRSPLREALRQLEAEGWIDYHPNRGAFVATVSAQDVRDLYMVRRILEAGAIRLAVPKLDKELLEKVRAIDLAMRKAADHRTAVELHRDFHESIYAAAGNQRLIDAIAKHYVRVQRLPDVQSRIDAVRKCSRADHRTLLEAFERRDVRAAERATLEHLDHLEAIMLDGLA